MDLVRKGAGLHPQEDLGWTKGQDSSAHAPQRSTKARVNRESSSCDLALGPTLKYFAAGRSHRSPAIPPPFTDLKAGTER